MSTTQDRNLNHYTLIQQHNVVNKIISLLSEPFTDKCSYIKTTFEYRSGYDPYVDISITREDIQVIISFYDNETINVSLYNFSNGRTIQVDFKQFDTDCLGDDFTKYLDSSVGVKYDN